MEQEWKLGGWCKDSNKEKLKIVSFMSVSSQNGQSRRRRPFSDGKSLQRMFWRFLLFIRFSNPLLLNSAAATHSIFCCSSPEYWRYNLTTEFIDMKARERSVGLVAHSIQSWIILVASRFFEHSIKQPNLLVDCGRAQSSKALWF